jgi:ArsR family metal-binding transcriptional regulator
MNDPDSVKGINKSARQRAREAAKHFVYEYLTELSCADCGETDSAVLTFDHVRGEKKMNISDMVQQGYSIGSIQAELEKTDVTCFNCHMRREQKRRGGNRFGLFGGEGD